MVLFLSQVSALFVAISGKKRIKISPTTKLNLHQNGAPNLLQMNPTTRGGTLTNNDNKVQSNEEDYK